MISADTAAMCEAAVYTRVRQLIENAAREMPGCSSVDELMNRICPVREFHFIVQLLQWLGHDAWEIDRIFSRVLFDLQETNWSPDQKVQVILGRDSYRPDKYCRIELQYVCAAGERSAS